MILAGGYVLLVAALRAFTAGYEGPHELVWDFALLGLTAPWSMLIVLSLHGVGDGAEAVIYSFAAAANGFLLYILSKALTGGLDPRP
ncbi:MAG TPA: hypothetical protein VG148_09780 [Pyrinomonadaceae bacterium]|nr:hypothetical protein [Pyrinomonadaceae bacterium]